jgi:hypothetical protein
MAFGSPRTNKFKIGTAELRIGALTSANKLLDTHSIGLIDSATVTVNQESVDLEGGFPKRLIDTAIVRQTAEITATLREYSRRNINTLLGNGVIAETTDVASTLANNESAGSTSVELASASGIIAGDIVTIYPVGSPEKVSVCRVASVATNTLTLDDDTPMLYNGTAGDPVFLSRPVSIGSVQKTNYFSVMLIEKENATGRPVVWSFWKGAVASGMEVATNADDFASTDITIKLLEPAASEYAVAGALYHLNDIIPAHPIGLYAGGSDV